MEQENEQPALHDLRHYTTLPALLSILAANTLTFSNPERWQDKNDFASLCAYQRVTGVEKIGVVCFASGKEAIVHWMRYAPQGGCIHFKTNKLLTTLKKDKRFIHGVVDYKSAKDLTASFLKALPPEKLPFIKRRPFDSENEYRVIWTSTENEEAPSLPLDGLIDCVTLAPEYADPSWAPLVSLLKKAVSVKIKQSRLYESAPWRTKFDQLGH